MKTKTARPARRSGTGQKKHQGDGATNIVWSGTDHRRDLDRLMREPGALAAVPVPPSLVELARRRAEVTA